MSTNKNCCHSYHLAYYFSSQVGKYKFILTKCEVIEDLKINILMFWVTAL
jgi:hypothetical protein